MNPFHDISVAIDLFYERTGHWPSLVFVGRMEWARMGVLTGSCGTSPFTMFHAGGTVPVRYSSSYYSTIAPVLEDMP